MEWQELVGEIENLASKIQRKPDCIVGIVRGGLIPGRLLSSKLGVKEMHCLTVKKVGEQRNVVTDINEDLHHKSILLVEDMLETGKSLIVAKQYLEQKGANVETACLYVMPASEIHPDHYLKEVKEIIRFPWE
jgi:hypoxanthine phosphoribosyltransferase